MHGKQKRQRPDKRIDVCASRRAKTLQVFAIARNELSADSGNIEGMINDRVVADARQPIAVGLAPERHEVGKRLRCHGIIMPLPSAARYRCWNYYSRLIVE